jgi:hypothetical protein
VLAELGGLEVALVEAGAAFAVVLETAVGLLLQQGHLGTQAIYFLALLLLAQAQQFAVEVPFLPQLGDLARVDAKNASELFPCRLPTSDCPYHFADVLFHVAHEPDGDLLAGRPASRFAGAVCGQGGGVVAEASSFSQHFNSKIIAT